MTEPKLPKVPPVETNEPIIETVPIPDPTGVHPQGIISTEREEPVKRYKATHLRETHGMTTEANRFRES